MIKQGNRVSLFLNIGKEGTVVGFARNPVKNTHWSTIPEASSQLLALVQWDDGTAGKYPISELMRID